MQDSSHKLYVKITTPSCAPTASLLSPAAPALPPPAINTPTPACFEGSREAVQDVLVMMQEPVVPMCFMRVRAVGVMHMIDQGERDDKIIAVHIDDPE